MQSQNMRVFLGLVGLLAGVACTPARHFSPANFLNPNCAGTANAGGMGLNCSAGDDICAGTPAPLCTADYAPNLPAICTLPCQTDRDCGSGGSCQHDAQSGLSLCLPKACLPASLVASNGQGSASPTCPPTGPNSAGVGLPCTQGGHQCANNPAPFCTVDYAVVPAAFCTKTCSSDVECGEGASCVGQAGVALRACIPNACMTSVGDTNQTPAQQGNSVDACPPPSPNEQSVGKACTQHGSQCAGGSAPYCTVDYFTTSYAFCTKTCSSDTDCGSGASCQRDPGGSGVFACVPTSCLALASGGNPNSGTTQAPTCGGNSRGVGKSCTSNGQQCSNVAAGLCSADLLPGLPGICTNFCSSDDACGPQATCVTVATGLSVCIPVRCINPGS